MPAPTRTPRSHGAAPATAGPAAAALVAALAALLLLALVPPPVAAQDASRRIADAEDPVTAAIRLSQDTVADGDARLVVLGRSDVFADNLAGAAATGAEGPLLLVDPAPQPLAGDVLSEVQRVLGQRSGDCADREPDVLVLGGAAAIDPSVPDRLEDVGYCTERLAGDERVGTSVAVALHHLERFLEPGVSRGTLLIATADNPADSAAASAWAASVAAPIVVTGGQQLDPQVADLLRPGDTSWDEVILLGGEAALSATLEDQVIEALQPGITTVRRIAGSTRDDTAFRVAAELWDPDLVRGAAIVEGYAEDFWALALPGAAAAARAGAPLLYAQTGFVPDPTDAYLRQQPLELLLTIGPATRISEATRAAAEASLGSGATPDPPPAGAEAVVLDSGVVHDHDGTPLTPPSNRNVTGMDVAPGGAIALTLDGELHCLCGDAQPTPLAMPPAGAELDNPIWTPDGSQIVVHVADGTTRDLAVVPRDGSGQLRMITDRGDVNPLLTSQAFILEGDRVVADTSGGMVIAAYLDGRPGYEIIEGRDPVVGPDGLTMLYQTADGTYAVGLDSEPDVQQVSPRTGPARFVTADLVVQVDALAGGLYAYDAAGAVHVIDETFGGMAFDMDVTGQRWVVVSNRSAAYVYDVPGGGGPVATIPGEDIQQVRFGSLAQ